MTTNQRSVADTYDTAIRKTSDTAITNQIEERKKELGKMFDGMEKHVMAAIGQKYSKEQFVATLHSALRANPEITKCSNHSILGTVLNAGLLGLRLDPTLGQAFIVPFYDKRTGKKEAQLVIGYKGMMALARRSGQIKRIECSVVYDNDTFQFKRGSAPFVEHAYDPSKDRGKPVAYYALVELLNGAIQFEIKSKAEVDKVRSRSSSPDSPAWKHNYDDMGMKTAFHSLSRWLPLDTELEKAFSTFSGETTQDYTQDVTQPEIVAQENGGVESSGAVLATAPTASEAEKKTAPSVSSGPQPTDSTESERAEAKKEEAPPPSPEPKKPAPPSDQSKAYKTLAKAVKSCRTPSDIKRTLEVSNTKLQLGELSQLERSHILMLLDEREDEIRMAEAK